MIYTEPPSSCPLITQLTFRFGVTSPVSVSPSGPVTSHGGDITQYHPISQHGIVKTFILHFYAWHVVLMCCAAFAYIAVLPDPAGRLTTAEEDLSQQPEDSSNQEPPDKRPPATGSLGGGSK